MRAAKRDACHLLEVLNVLDELLRHFPRQYHIALHVAAWASPGEIALELIDGGDVSHGRTRFFERARSYPTSREVWQQT